MRFGFVGLGFAAQWLHLPALRALPGSEVVGGFDIDAGRREAWSALGVSRTFDQVETLLESARPDVVVVSTPPDSHARYCKLALEAGADVMCEKPFVATVAEADEVLAVARSAARTVAVNHEFRYMPIFACLARVVGRPDVGRPVLLHCTQFMDLAPWDEKVPWRAAMSDRALFEGGVHLVDLLHMVAGRSPRAVSSMTSAGLDLDRRADAVHLVTLDYGGGLLGQITIDRLCRAGTRYADVQVDCEHASLRASFGGYASVRIGATRAAERPGIRVDFGPGGLTWLERGLHRKVIARNGRDATVKATAALYAATADAWRRGTEPPTTAAIARETLRVIEASYRSARTGERVVIDA